MKISLLSLLFFVLTVSAKAQDWYINNSGSDSNPGTILLPFKTIAKGNTKTGHHHYAAGQIFQGTISWHAGDQYNTYGSGIATISGFNTETAWIPTGDGLTWSVVDINLPSTMLNMVTVNGNQVNIGRTPRNTWNTFTSPSNTSVVSTTPVGTFTGKPEIVLSKADYVKDRFFISSISGTTINYSGGGGIDLSIWNGNKYFIQNAPQCLIRFGDWCYDPSAHKITMYFGPGVTPSSYTIQASALTYGANGGTANVTFDNLKFTGQNSWGINSAGAANLIIQNCTFDNEGINAMKIYNSPNAIIQNNTITNCANSGIIIDLYSNVQVLNNSVKNCGTVVGMGQNQDQASGGEGSYSGISAVGVGNNGLFKFNRIDRVGYNGIRFSGQNNTVQNNWITNGCLVMGDGALIYSHGASDLSAHGQNFILNNVVDGSFGDPSATTNGQSFGNLIYMDDLSVDCTITGNTISNGAYGIYNHNSQRIINSNNLIYGTKVGINSAHDGVVGGLGLIRDLTINNNQIITTLTTQLNIQLTSLASNSSNADATLWGTGNNNLYATNSGLTSGFRLSIFPGFGTRVGNLALWQTNTLQDPASTFTNVVAVNQFNSNGTGNPVSIPLTDNYRKLDGTLVPAGSYTLGAYSGVFLIFDSHPASPPIPAYSPATNTYTEGTPITTITPTNTGTVATSWSVSPALPAGLTINSATGVLSGTPTAASVTTTYTVTAHSGSGDGTTNITITVNGLRPNLSYVTPQTYPVGVVISALHISNTGDPVTSSYTISPAIGNGLLFNSSTADITGTPIAAHTAIVYSIIGSNSAGADTATVSIAIADIAPIIHYSPASYVLTKGHTISAITPINTGGNPTGYTISPSLPTGLSFSLSTGKITGNPSVIHSATSYLVTASNGTGNGTTHVSIKVVSGNPRRGIVIKHKKAVLGS